MRYTKKCKYSSYKHIHIQFCQNKGFGLCHSIGSLIIFSDKSPSGQQIGRVSYFLLDEYPTGSAIWTGLIIGRKEYHLNFCCFLICRFVGRKHWTMTRKTGSKARQIHLMRGTLKHKWTSVGISGCQTGSAKKSRFSIFALQSLCRFIFSESVLHASKTCRKGLLEGRVGWYLLHRRGYVYNSTIYIVN